MIGSRSCTNKLFAADGAQLLQEEVAHGPLRETFSRLKSMHDNMHSFITSTDVTMSMFAFLSQLLMDLAWWLASNVGR